MHASAACLRTYLLRIGRLDPALAVKRRHDDSRYDLVTCDDANRRDLHRLHSVKPREGQLALHPNHTHAQSGDPGNRCRTGICLRNSRSDSNRHRCASLQPPTAQEQSRINRPDSPISTSPRLLQVRTIPRAAVPVPRPKDCDISSLIYTIRLVGLLNAQRALRSARWSVVLDSSLRCPLPPTYDDMLWLHYRY